LPGHRHEIHVKSLRWFDPEMMSLAPAADVRRDKVPLDGSQFQRVGCGAVA
jgi:hypothetical protein